MESVREESAREDQMERVREVAAGEGEKETECSVAEGTSSTLIFCGTWSTGDDRDDGLPERQREPGSAAKRKRGVSPLSDAPPPAPPAAELSTTPTKKLLRLRRLVLNHVDERSVGAFFGVLFVCVVTFATLGVINIMDWLQLEPLTAMYLHGVLG
ncbi:hypothetical protein AURANDRAFT_69254 [Aureococcus anophagefferens]|uniref:Uncharacterized protein n=1 Tax=Aureococcus anophagefferens TaxID=44056 RepID=F0YS71_AURAN|nr:hypothetical protein AURANDRAFT_69254 [Aureococcus anophagefferens]EGB02038.1 hypothetical protein AURANDRAFT_69254 [Aureococcus anophagefferens]|eukprot:XP_009043262.1 hypothetical protein AURANDRAFT_69254 [Aureococcus anophagefferens]